MNPSSFAGPFNKSNVSD